MKATVQHAFTYIAPEAKIFASTGEHVICVSPTGSTSNDGYSEDTLEW